VVLLLLIVVVLAAFAEPLPQGMVAVSAGDMARWSGDRVTAREQYRLAVQEGGPEAVAMARLRLLGLSGNLGALVHGPAIDTALTELEGPWGWLAVADFYLLAPPPIGGDMHEAVQAAERALQALPGPAAARLYLATGDAEWLDALALATDRDGLGDALVAHQGEPAPDPGTWALGLGVAGAPGAGFGAGLVFMHPDLAARGWRVSLHVAGATRGTFDLGASARSPALSGVFAGVFAHGGLALGRVEGDYYTADGNAQGFVQLHTAARLGPGWTRGDWSVWGGGLARWDQVPSTLVYPVCNEPGAICDATARLAGNGAYFGAAWDNSTGWGADRRGARLSLGFDGVIPPLASYRHLSWRAEARGYVGAVRGVLAGRLLWRQELMASAPFFRLPSAGGADIHRGAWAGRYRADRILALDVEQRWMVSGPLEAVVFFSGAWVEPETGGVINGLHPGGGAGVRLLFPPEELNVIRLDVALSDSGWGVYAGWGETF
jgi:hypothetical protein